MSIETLTGDEFIDLDIDEHEEALRLYATAIEETLRKQQAYAVGTTAHEDGLDQLRRQLNLRKVHQVRLDEMHEEAQSTPLS